MEKIYEKINDNKENITIVKTHALWCAPCRKLSKVIEETLNEEDINVLVLEVNVDENVDFIKNENIQSVPTLCFYKNNIEVERKIGLISKEELIKTIKKHT
jgi:thioredoxin 1